MRISHKMSHRRFQWRSLFPPHFPCWLVQLGIALALSSATAAAWPQGYVLYEKSRSPDGHHGVMLPGREAGIAEEGGGENYLADLTTGQLLGEIAGADYFEGQNHRDLNVVWTPDSKWCVVTYEGRYGFDSISILEPKGAEFTQTEIGEHIQKALDAAIAKQSRDPELGGYGNAYFRTQPDRKLLVRALGYTNPKSMEGVETYHACFAGTFDLNSKKWTASRSHKLSSEEHDAISSGYPDYTGKDFIVIKDPAKEKVPEGFIGAVLSSDEEKAEHIERALNGVYQAVRFALPAGRFATVKQEQRAWLKKRDAIRSPDEKCKFTEARIRTLEDFLW